MTVKPPGELLPWRERHTEVKPHCHVVMTNWKQSPSLPHCYCLQDFKGHELNNFPGRFLKKTPDANIDTKQPLERLILAPTILLSLSFHFVIILLSILNLLAKIRSKCFTFNGTFKKCFCYKSCRVKGGLQFWSLWGNLLRPAHWSNNKSQETFKVAMQKIFQDRCVDLFFVLTDLAITKSYWACGYLSTSRNDKKAFQYRLL